MTTPKETQKALIDATNLICDHVADRLPAGWELVLSMRSGEADLSLFDSDGNEIDVPPADRGISQIDAACQDAREAYATR